MLISVLSFIFVLGALIFFHELGHFLVAKKVGIRVDRFSLGFPPNIFKKKFGETEYCIGCIPLGGYVKMAGENPDEEASGAPDEFMSKSILQRFLVIFAGPFMNYILAIAILVGVFYFVGQEIWDKEEVFVSKVMEDGPAAKAGILADDQILAVGDMEMPHYDSVSALINAVVEQPLKITWLRGNDTLSADITTMPRAVAAADGGEDTVGIIGVYFVPKLAGHEKFSLPEAISAGFFETHHILDTMVVFVRQMVTGQQSAKQLGGPIFIAQESGRQARRGPVSLFLFMALLSVNLAVLNVLPIPVLDGGHMVFLLIEKLKGSPLSMKARLMAQQVGMLALLTLIVFVTYNDIARFFSA